MDDIILPVKCSTLKSFNKNINTLNCFLFVVYCIVSSMLIILNWYEIISIDGSTPLGMMYIVGGFAGLFVLMLMLAFVISWCIVLIGAYLFKVIPVIIEMIPKLKCIEDEV